MSLVDIFVAQLTEPFRIGLLVALVVTAARTTAAVGTLVPIALGLIFVAVMIPLSLGQDGVDRTMQMVVGLASNFVILVVVLAGKALAVRFWPSP